MRRTEVAEQKDRIALAKKWFNALVEELLDFERKGLPAEDQRNYQTVDDLCECFRPAFQYVNYYLSREDIAGLKYWKGEAARIKEEYAASWYDPDWEDWRDGYPYEAGIFRRLEEVCEIASNQVITFEFFFCVKEERRWNFCRCLLKVDRLVFISDGDEVEIEHGPVTIVVEINDGFSPYELRELEGPADILFEAILSGYLRGDKRLRYVIGSGWETYFGRFKKTPDKNGLIPELYQYGAVLKKYILDLATPEYRFYHCEDEQMMLDAKGSIVTDVEPFFLSALCKEIGRIMEGETPCLYESDGLASLIIENGRDYFIEEK